MRNADLPAMPSKVSVGEGGCIPFQFGNRDFVSPGLTKREYFAVMAMQGILANQNYEAPRRKKLAGMAEDAVSAADALLEELDKRVT